LSSESIFQERIIDSAFVAHKYAFMRTTLDLPDDLLKEAKAASAMRGISLKAYFTEALLRQSGSIRRKGGGAKASHVCLPLIGHGGGRRVRPSGGDLEDALVTSEKVHVQE
jgi:hypothetical protein